MSAPQPATHRIAAAVLVEQDRVLRCHRHPDRTWLPNSWDLPGGHIELREQPRAALVRELHEELGICVAQDAAIPYAALRPNADLEIHIFIVRSWSGEVMNRAPDEHDALEWFASGELDALTVADPDVIEASRAALAARPNNGSAA